jgi:hypothetical protein
MSALPAAVAIPGWTAEQIVSTAFCFAASGVNVFLGSPFPVQGVPVVDDYLSVKFADKYGGSLSYELSVAGQAERITKLLSEKRALSA